MLPTWYDAGTVSVANGSTTVTGTSTLWGGDAIMPGDLFCDLAQPAIPPQRIASVEANGSLTLATEWPGTTMTDAAYEIRYVGIIERSTAQSRRVLEELGVVDANGRGLFYNFIGVTGDVDPAVGNVSVDNATFADITHIYIDDIDANTNGQDATSTISLWTPGTILILRSPRSAAYMSFRVVSVTINTGYRDIEVTPIGQSSTLTSEPIAIDWAIVGEGVTIDFVGTFADRDDYDAADEGKFYASIDGEDGLGGPTVLYRKESAASGDWSPAIPFQGAPGDRGWAPVFAVVSDGARRVQRLVDYVGGQGSKPTAGINQYVSAAGMTATIGDATDIRGATGATGAAGTNGTNGVDGTDPGILLNWDDGTADEDPGSGNMRANDVDLSVAGEIYVSKTNRAGDNIAAYLLAMASSTNAIKGGLVLTRSGGNAQAIVHVTGVTDATGYVKVSITNHSGATGFIGADAVSFQFTRYGDQGAADAVSVASAINGAPEVTEPDAATKFAITDPDNSDNLSWISLTTLAENITPPAGEVDAKSSNYTVLEGDAGKVLLVNAAAAARTITLPPAATAGNGFRIIIKKSDSSANTVTIDGDGSETIDGATTYVLRMRYQYVALICNGTNWYIVNAVDGIAVDRAALASMSGSTYPTIKLLEAGREGTFLWNSSNLSAMVTADPDQGVYIPPVSDATGASGAWVREVGGDLWLNWFGFSESQTALNNVLIFNRVILLARNPHRTIVIPPGEFDISVIGGGSSANNGIKLVSDTHIRGCGQRKSALNLVGASPKANVDNLSGGCGIGRIYTPGVANDGINNVLLEEFAVTMNHPGTGTIDPTTHLQVAIDFRHINRSTVRRCYIGNFSPINGMKGFAQDYLAQGFAVALGGASGAAVDYAHQELNIIEECTIVGARHGISMEFVGTYTGAAYQTTIRRNDIQMCQRLIVQNSTGGAGNIIQGNTLQNLVKPNGDATATVGIWIRGYGNIVDEAYGEYGSDAQYILLLDSTSARNWLRFSATQTASGGLVTPAYTDTGTNNVIEYFANTGTTGTWNSQGGPRRRVNQVDTAMT